MLFYLRTNYFIINPKTLNGNRMHIIMFVHFVGKQYKGRTISHTNQFVNGDHYYRTTRQVRYMNHYFVILYKDC